MKVDTTQILKTIQGEDMFRMEEVDGKEKKKILSLRDILTDALNGENVENRLTSEKKNKAWQLMKKLWDGNGKEVNFTIDDLAYMKERVGIFYNPMTYGLISDLFEGGKSKQDDKAD